MRGGAAALRRVGAYLGGLQQVGVDLQLVLAGRTPLVLVLVLVPPAHCEQPAADGSIFLGPNIHLLLLLLWGAALRRRQGHDGASALVPHHPPEVPHGSGQRILGNDELAAVAVALQPIRR